MTDKECVEMLKQIVNTEVDAGGDEDRLKCVWSLKAIEEWLLEDNKKKEV